MNDVETLLADWEKRGDTIAAHYRVGIGVSMACTGKIVRVPMGEWAFSGENGVFTFDVTRAECRFVVLPVPSVLLDVLGGGFAPCVELLIETGERCVLWKVPART